MAWLKRKATTVWHVAQRALDRAESWFGRERREHPWFGHVVRAGVRYNEAKGDRLAAALTYRSFLAVFPVLLLAFSVLGFVLQGNPEATREVADYLEQNLPTLRVEAIAGQRLAAGIIGVIGVLFAGLSWVEEVRAAVRAMWNREQDPG
ncbi:MAG: YihY/virulence factor BrkB family protein, partial [Mycobacteriales bacterium]